MANVRFHTIGRLADQLGGPTLARARRLPATNAVVHAAIRAALGDATTGLLAPVRTHPATERAMATLVRELRDVSPAGRARLAAGSERAAQVTALAGEVERRLAGWYDEHDLIEAALQVIATDPARVAELGEVVVHLPGPLRPIEERFVAALGEATRLTVILGATGEPTADDSARLLAERLAPGATTTFPSGEVVTGTEVVERAERGRRGAGGRAGSHGPPPRGRPARTHGHRPRRGGSVSPARARGPRAGGHPQQRGRGAPPVGDHGGPHPAGGVGAARPRLAP